MRPKQHLTAEATAPWWDLAACLDEDPELFFPIGTGAEEHLEAKDVCRRCAVRSECLAWAMHLGRPAGIWGGLDEKERTALMRRVPQQRG